jgi:hypothetical protein
MSTSSAVPKYPLLQEILSIKDIQLQATYTIRDIAKIFSVSVRAIQSRVASGQLISRNLPGRAKFLPQNLESFLTGSRNRERRHV